MIALIDHTEVSRNTAYDLADAWEAFTSMPESFVNAHYTDAWMLLQDDAVNGTYSEAEWFFFSAGRAPMD